MKKILVVAICCLFLLTGCGKKTNSWEKTVQLSEFTIEDNYAKGEIKNLTDKAYKTTITLELKSGDLTKEDICYETIKPNEIRKVRCILNDDSDKYTVNIKNVELKEFSIPALESELSVDALEYHFEDIYDAHLYNFLSISTNDEIDKLPYIDKIEYNDNTITITGTIIQNSNFLYYAEEFNSKNAELNHAFFYTSIDNDPEYNNKLLTQISLMKSFRGDDFDLATAVNKALLRTDIEDGYCVRVGKWCISTKQDDKLNSYLIIGE